MVFLSLFVVFGFFSVFFLRCIYYVWRLYLLGHGEQETAVMDEIVKGKKRLARHYSERGRWVYTVYVRLTYQGESFREKIRLVTTTRIKGFARGCEIPVIVSRDKRGNLWVFQRRREDKWEFAFAVVFSGFYALLLGLLTVAVLSNIISH